MEGGWRLYRLRGLVEGRAEAPVLAVPHPLSLYGEVDPETGAVHGVGESVAGRILVAPGTRGSTVGPYILYALAKRGRAPAGIVVSEAEPILVAGAVMAGVPLASGLPRGLIESLAHAGGSGCTAVLEVEPPRAILRLHPSCPLPSP